MKEIKVNMKWVGAVLLLSLAVNFFAIGYFFSQKKITKHTSRHAMENKVTGLVEYFPRSKRKEFFQIIHKNSKDYNELNREVEAAKFIIFETLSEKEINKPKLLEAYENYRIVTDRLQIKLHKMMVITSLKMDQKTRKRSLERLRKKRIKSEKWYFRKDKSQNFTHKNVQILRRKKDSEHIKFLIKRIKTNKKYQMRLEKRLMALQKNKK